ncbi:MAG: 2-oxo-tetronate isomerase [Rhodovibrionaceae bacterium]
MPKFAANLTWLFTEHPFLERFSAAAGEGFSGVEYLFPYAWSRSELRQQLQDAGMSQVLINAPPGDWDNGDRGLAACPGRQQEFAESLELAVDYAQALDCPCIHVMAGLKQEVESESAEDVYVTNLQLAAERFAAAGIKLLIEPINRRDMPGYFLGSVAEARGVRRLVDHKNLYLQLDLYHAQVTSGDLSRLIEENLDWIGHIQVAGPPGRHEPDRGEVNFPHLFALLDRFGYSGWIGCEYAPERATAEGLRWGKDYGLGRQEPSRDSKAGVPV